MSPPVYEPGSSDATDFASYPVRVLVHFRLTAPRDLTDAVCATLLGHDWITNVTVQPGVVRQPAGDLVECDAAREKAGEIVERLSALGMDQRGGIVITTPTGTPFAAATAMGRAAPGHPDDAVIWGSVEERAEADAVPTISYHVFLVLAVALAAVAVITDSAVLVVGAMVVGPEYSAIAAITVGLVRRRPRLAWRGLRLLVLSFLLAIVVVTVLAVLARATGLATLEQLLESRPNTGFIWRPDRWSFIVALLAGAAGALALAIEKTATMVGVFISVTTVPAAGNLALGLAFTERSEILGSLGQLGANVAGMVVSGALVLLLMRVAWPWLTARSERLFGLRTSRT